MNGIGTVRTKDDVVTNAGVDEVIAAATHDEIITLAGADGERQARTDGINKVIVSGTRIVAVGPLRIQNQSAIGGGGEIHGDTVGTVAGVKICYRRPPRTPVRAIDQDDVVTAAAGNDHATCIVARGVGAVADGCGRETRDGNLTVRRKADGGSTRSGVGDPDIGIGHCSIRIADLERLDAGATVDIEHRLDAIEIAGRDIDGGGRGVIRSRGDKEGIIATFTLEVGQHRGRPDIEEIIGTEAVDIELLDIAIEVHLLEVAVRRVFKVATAIGHDLIGGHREELEHEHIAVVGAEDIHHVAAITGVDHVDHRRTRSRETDFIEVTAIAAPECNARAVGDAVVEGLKPGTVIVDTDDVIAGATDEDEVTADGVDVDHVIDGGAHRSFVTGADGGGGSVRSRGDVEIVVAIAQRDVDHIEAVVVDCIRQGRVTRHRGMGESGGSQHASTGSRVVTVVEGDLIVSGLTIDRQTAGDVLEAGAGPDRVVNAADVNPVHQASASTGVHHGGVAVASDDVNCVATAAQIQVESLDSGVFDAVVRIAHAKASDTSGGEHADVGCGVTRVIHVEDFIGTESLDHQSAEYGIDRAADRRRQAADIEHRASPARADGGGGHRMGAADVSLGQSGTGVNDQVLDARVTDARGGNAGDFVAHQTQTGQQAVG